MVLRRIGRFASVVKTEDDAVLTNHLRRARVGSRYRHHFLDLLGERVVVVGGQKPYQHFHRRQRSDRCAVERCFVLRFESVIHLEQVPIAHETQIRAGHIREIVYPQPIVALLRLGFQGLLDGGPKDRDGRIDPQASQRQDVGTGVVHVPRPAAGSTCTNNKSYPIPPDCQLGELKSLRFDSAVKKWHENLTSKKFHKIPAEQLYVGSHWKETLRCVQEAKLREFNTTFWILSAGWGLLLPNTKISPYATTFTSSGDDSIHSLGWPEELSHGERCRLWWEHVNAAFSTEKHDSIRSIGQDDEAQLLFILSKDYFLAIEQELLEIAAKGCQVLIVSAGLYTEGTAHPQLKDHILSFNDKFKQIDPYLNKTDVSLNARLAN